MTATITLSDRREPLPVHDEVKVQAIIDAVSAQTGDTFRVRDDAPDGRKRVVVFRTSEVTGICVNGIDLLDAPSPVSEGRAAA